MKKFKTSGWKAAGPARSNTTSSIRGKISAPIPMGVSDDEFPIRVRGNSIVTPLGKDGSDMQLRRPAALVPDEKPLHKEEGGHTAPSTEPSLSVAPSHESSLRRVRQVSPWRASGVTAAVISNESQLQRKQSTLRTVLGRLFGRKRKSTSSASVSTSGNPRDSPRMNLHRSDPSALRRPSGLALSPQRSASMPINEYSRALASHAPFATDGQGRGLNNDPAPKEEEDGRSRPRRGSTASRFFEPTKTAGYSDWTGLSPRPASSHARGSVLFGDASGSPIGYAVTSGSHPHRRSRSVGDMRDPARQGTFRRRSDEIRYLRESYDPDALSPMSLEHKSELSAAHENDASRERDVLDAPQPFNFGHLGELAGMKITQAAGLESRITTIEARLERMERAIGHLVHRRPSSSYATRPKTGSSEQSFPRQLPRKMYLQAHNPQADTSYRTQDLSFDDSRPSTTSTQPSYTQSHEELSPRPAYQPSPEPPPELQRTRSLLQSESMARPLSTTTTIRAVASSSPSRSPTSSAPLSKSGSLTAQHYSALMNLIVAEKTARQDLESLVASLQMQIQSLTASSPRVADDSNPKPGNHPHRKAMGLGGEFSSFEHDESVSEGEGKHDHEGESYTSGPDDAYETPSEEKDNDLYESDNEIGGEERRGSEPRTLSLSQMTMKRAGLTQVGV